MTSLVVLTLCVLFQGQDSDNLLFAHSHIFQKIAQTDSVSLYFATSADDDTLPKEFGLYSWFIEQSHGQYHVVQSETYSGGEGRLPYWCIDLTGDGVKEVIACPEDEANFDGVIYEPKMLSNGHFVVRRAFEQPGGYIPDSLVIDPEIHDSSYVNGSPVAIRQSHDGSIVVRFQGVHERSGPFWVEVGYDRRMRVFNVIGRSGERASKKKPG